MATSESDGLLMTEEVVIQQCKKHHGYSTPELNRNIYLNHLGLMNISSLNAFHQCRVLYLNNNAIDNLEGLHPLQNLHALYIGNNAIRNCKSFPMLPSLRLVDISSNFIESLEGLSSIPNLETLLASRNRVRNLRGVEGNRKLMTIDVSKNAIEREEDIVPWILEMEGLRSCMLQGNRFVTSMQSYRKKIIAWVPSLRFMDQCPVFPEERSCAEAYAQGGTRAEKAQRDENRRQEEQERQRQFEFFGSQRQEARESRDTKGPTCTNTAYYDDNDLQCIYVPNSVGRV